MANKNFSFNHILEEVDAFISVANMKCHFNCGVTHSMKNLIGLVPVNHYRLSEEHWWRPARLEEIEVVGASIDDVLYEFEPSRRQR
jgi:uncharacterized protein (DUF362 family)